MIYMEQIEAIAARANAWLDFAIVCGWIGFGFSMLALLILIVKVRRGK